MRAQGLTVFSNGIANQLRRTKRNNRVGVTYFLLRIFAGLHIDEVRVRASRACAIPLDCGK
jgi:hypothetical protein